MDNKLIFTCEISVRWGDMDAVGHVNNAAYFTYMEQARVAWLDSVGLAEVVRRPLQGPVIVSVACEYKQPIVHPATLWVKMYASAPGRSSFETRYEILDTKTPGLLYALGKAHLVWVDHKQGRSIPIPPAIRAFLPPSQPPSEDRV
ncbi:MAG: acyl-CoA thioesterase [Gammaproteobacteria bacterium]